ncbi:MAG: excinuclease ABC subunit UvrC [Verrucomicrobiales bacterium]
MPDPPPIIAGSKPDLLKKLQVVPHKPGVYLHKDRFGKVIYVGKAKDLRKRLSHYFTPAQSRLSDLKTRALIHSIWDFDFHAVRNEPESILLEGKLIKEFRPRYNIDFRDDKRFLLVRVHLDEPWPRFSLTRLKRDDSARYFGPFAHSGALRMVLNWLNQRFGLRACRPLRPGEIDYKHCSNDIIKNCSAPCIAKIDREAYLARVREACEFLEGGNRATLVALEEEMHRAAENMNFERAAGLRDMLDNFRKTLSPMRRFTRGRGVPNNHPAAEALGDVEDLQNALRLPRPPLIMECFDISNISSNHIVASMVRFKNGVPDSSNYRRYRIRTVLGQNDFASMAEVVRRRYWRILLEARDQVPEALAETQESPVEALQRLGARIEGAPSHTTGRSLVCLPDLIIIDGGKGQLSSALEELHRLGLSDLPIIGLAKHHEEIFRPGHSEPLLLSHTRGALKLLQRIRDEAHRWANAYHQLLMKRRVGESLLDDCPGVSESRKRALLRGFGSVARLRKASVEEIATIPGVGRKLAAEVVAYLEGH